MAPRRRCTTCGSKQWHKEPSSGLIACSEGHILQNYRNEVIEAEQAGPHAMKKRTLKSSRKKKETQSKANPELYHGALGRSLYFQCTQYILRTQIVAVTKLWDLPLEFEVICRDIWALHLELLPNALPAEPHDHAQENQDPEDEDPLIVGKGMGNPTPETEDKNTPPPPLPKEENNDSGSGPSSSDEEDYNVGDPDEEDPGLAELLRENSESSASDDEGGGDTGRVPIEESRGNRKAKHRYEGLSNTVVVLILGFWTLRIPILYRDVIMAIESYDLPYLDAVRVLPKNLAMHLTKHKIQALSPHHAPAASLLHTLASRLARKMYSVYGIHTPEANAAPILWRVTQALGGSPVLYGMIKRLSHSLSLPLTIHHSLAPGLKKTKPHDPEGHRYDNVAPEVGFVAAAVIVLQMVYGLDGKSRYPCTVGDPACALARADEYRVRLKAIDDDEFCFDSRRSMSVGEMSEDTVDDYLGFCERALLGPLDGDDDVVDKYFPLPERHRGNSARTRDDRLRRCAAMILGEGGSETGVLRPGEGCRIYNGMDVSGSAAEEYEEVVKVGARWSKVGEEYLGGVVEQLQRRLMRRCQRDNV